ncbi:MAG: hypothetical protein MZV70_29315 [Desulfobacterales bacterium]|nr:hypothetical protein [Desulfobacterales bacterium]
MNQTDIDKLTRQGGSRGLESALSSPSPASPPNANGAIHPRGAHNQMTHVVDGMPIYGDQLTGSFANAARPEHRADASSSITGNVPAEFGSKSLRRRRHHHAQRRWQWPRDRRQTPRSTPRSFDTLFAGERRSPAAGKLGYFAIAERDEERTASWTRVAGQPAQRQQLRTRRSSAARLPGRGDDDTLLQRAWRGRSSFQLANLRSQRAAGHGPAPVDWPDGLQVARLRRTLAMRGPPLHSTTPVAGYRPTRATLPAEPRRRAGDHRRIAPALH